MWGVHSLLFFSGTIWKKNIIIAIWPRRVHARPARPDMSHEDEGHEVLPCNVVDTSRKRVHECISPCKSGRRDDDQTWTSALILADSQCARLRWCVAACCIAALPGKRQSARARLRSAALLLCLASAKRRPLQWCQLMTQLIFWSIFAGHRSAAVFSGQRSATVFSLRKSWPSRGIATAVCNSEQPGHWLLAPGHHGRCHTLT